MNTATRHPILTLDEARDFEATLFGGDPAREWAAMSCAGTAVAAAIVADYEEIGGFPRGDARVLVLVGKGHNGGDALLAAQRLLKRFPSARAEVFFAFGERKLKPLAMRAYRALTHQAGGRVSAVTEVGGAYALALDGVFGFQFKPPLEARTAGMLKTVNALPVGLRAAVDLPSGLGAEESFRADFTYATGSVKTPLLEETNREHVGRIRYLDLGFFEAGGRAEARDFVLTPRILDPLRAWRAPVSDKRTYGNLLVLGGSRNLPGAVLMSVLAALKSGAGLVTAFVPESLAAAYAAQVPEAMWVGWPEAPGGGLALEGAHLFRERASRASALLIGPGLSREPETLALAADIVKTAEVPLVIDADALQPGVVHAGGAPRVITPHAGEFARIAAGKNLREFSRAATERTVTVLKGPITQVAGGDGAIHHSFFGGPVLARGGSGDLLAGMIGGLLAGNPGAPFTAACQGVVWHGLAAEVLARGRGQVAVRTTELLAHLPAALREPAGGASA